MGKNRVKRGNAELLRDLDIILRELGDPKRFPSGPERERVWQAAMLMLEPLMLQPKKQAEKQEVRPS